MYRKRENYALGTLFAHCYLSSGGGLKRRVPSTQHTTGHISHKFTYHGKRRKKKNIDNYSMSSSIESAVDFRVANGEPLQTFVIRTYLKREKNL